MFYVLFVDADDYESRVIQHNSKQTDPYADSGFDLACPSQLTVEAGTLFIDFKVKAAMYKSETPIDLNHLEMEKYTPSAYYLYPRSSISKTSSSATCASSIAERTPCVDHTPNLGPPVPPQKLSELQFGGRPDST